MNNHCSLKVPLIQMQCPICRLDVQDYFSLGQHVAVMHSNPSNSSSVNASSSNKDILQNEPSDVASTSGLNKKIRKKYKRSKSKAYANVPFNANSLGSKRMRAASKFKWPYCPKKFMRKTFLEEHQAAHMEIWHNDSQHDANDAMPNTRIENKMDLEVNSATFDYGVAGTSKQEIDENLSNPAEKVRRKYKRKHRNCYANVPFNGSSLWSKRKVVAAKKKIKEIQNVYKNNATIDPNSDAPEFGLVGSTNEVIQEPPSIPVEKVRRKYKRRRPNCYANVPFNGKAIRGSRKSFGTIKTFKVAQSVEKESETLTEISATHLVDSNLVESKKETIEERKPAAIELFESTSTATPHRTPEYDNIPDTAVPQLSFHSSTDNSAYAKFKNAGTESFPSSSIVSDSQFAETRMSFLERTPIYGFIKYNNVGDQLSSSDEE